MKLLEGIAGVTFEEVDLVEAEGKLLLAIEHVLLELLQCKS